MAGPDIEIKFLDVINGYFPEQLILEPRGEEAILDINLSNIEDLVQEVPISKPLCNSYCNIITFNILAGGRKPKKSTMQFWEGK